MSDWMQLVGELKWSAVAVSAVAIFILGALWYSVLFAKPWMAALGKTREELMAGGASPVLYVFPLLSALLVSITMGTLVYVTETRDADHAIGLALLCWLGLAGGISFTPYLFSKRTKAHWAIDAGYMLASIFIATLVTALWR